MALYTQTLYQYMLDRKLDPFDEKDQVEAGRSLLKVTYDVPKEIMDVLLQRFVVRYLTNELAFESVERFRLELMKYAISKKAWYEKMYEVFKEQNPYEIIGQTKETLTEREGKESRIHDKTSLSERTGLVSGLYDVKKGLTSATKGLDSRTAASNLSGTDKGNERNNDNTSQVGTKGRTGSQSTNTNVSANKSENELSNHIERKTGGNTTVTTDSGSKKILGDNSASENINENVNISTDNKRSLSGTDNKTMDKTGLDSDTVTGKDLRGFGSMDSFTAAGVMVDETKFQDVTTDKTYGTKEKTVSDSASSDNLIGSETKGKTGTNTTTGNTSENITNNQTSNKTDTLNERLSGSDGKSLRGSNAELTKGVVSDKENVTTTDRGNVSGNRDHNLSRKESQTNNEKSNTQSTRSDKEDSKTITSQDSSSNNKEDVAGKSYEDRTSQGKEVERLTGMSLWKPELARKFFDMYVDIDAEWIKECRYLFSFIY